MAQKKERLEKKCLNCNADLHGRFCHNCGQANTELKESVLSMIKDFFAVPPIDGKFFTTLKYLLFRPGFLSKEYVSGKRTAYLLPIRIYSFISLVFFGYLYNYFFKTEYGYITNGEFQKGSQEYQVKAKELEEKAIYQLKMGSTDKDKNRDVLQSNINNVLSNYKDFLGFTHQDLKGAYDVRTYDSIQNTLRPSERANYFAALWLRNQLMLLEKYDYDRMAITKLTNDKFNKLLPKILYISLPFMAFFLTLLQSSRKEFYVLDHVIFTIHLYSTTFILILTNIWIGSMLDWINLKSDVSDGLFFILIFIYWAMAFKNFYLESKWKTVLKFLLLVFLTVFLIFLLAYGFAIFSNFEL